MASKPTPTYGSLEAGRDEPHTTSAPHRESAEVDVEASEATPLISQPHEDGDHGDANTDRGSAASLLRSIQGENKPRRRWPSIIALVLLCVVVVVIMILGFVAPQAMKEYAQQAVTFKPTNLSIANLTETGVRARIQGDFCLDSARVKKGSVRGFGRFGTWIASQAESGHTTVEVSLPELGGTILGVAQIPPIVVNLRDGHTTHVDFLADLTPGDESGIRKLAKDWIDGRLGRMRIKGTAQVPVKSGIFSLGQQTISQYLLIEDSDLPTIPKYDITKIQFHDVDAPGRHKAVRADAQVRIANTYPVDLRIPPLAFDVLAPNCLPSQPHIPLAYVSTETLHIQPREDVTVGIFGVIEELPPAFTQTCPDKQDSPMDLLVGEYIHGENTTVFVRGSSKSSEHVPPWMSDLISQVTIPISVPGQTFGHLIKNFSLANVHFQLPDPTADEGTPEADPAISATIKAVVALPEQMNFNVSVHHVRADADVFYRGSKLGHLDLRRWQSANSTRLSNLDEDGKANLLVQSDIERAPLDITDDEVFTQVIQALLFGGRRVVLGIKAKVDVEIDTAIGELTVRGVPASGLVPIKPIGRHVGVDTVKPEVGQLQILDTSETSLTFAALINMTNPTEYFASIPYADVQIMNNGSVLGHATVQHVNLKPGRNTNIPVTAVWDPLSQEGEVAHAVGVELLSQYISGFNTTITVRTHEGSVPSRPNLGRALSNFTIEIPTPQLLASPHDDDEGDGDDDDQDPDEPKDPSDPKKQKPRQGLHFISDATMHLISSTATFTLTSPLRTSTLYVTHINATALFKGDEVGHIDYDQPFAVPPAVPITTPALPVDWSLGSVGYDAIRKAVGGRLKLAAQATVGIRIGRWEETIWYLGRGIGAKIRL